MLLRLIVVLLLVFWVLPVLARALARRGTSRSRRPAAPPPAPPDERLAGLTRQDITDAEFEELPPEK